MTAGSDPIYPRPVAALGQHDRDIQMLKREKKVPTPTGVLLGGAGLSAAYAAPGSLVWLYRLGEAFTPSGTVANACLDTSNYDATPRNLTYKENSGASDWSTANRPTTHSVEHSGLGTADDGCIRFKYNGFFPGTQAQDGGTWLESNVTGLAIINSGLLSVTGWFNAESTARTGGTAPLGLVCGTYNGSGSGGSTSGWGVIFDFVDNSLRVYMGSAGNVATVSSLSRGGWYHMALTYAPGTDTFTLYVNAVSSATWTGSGNTGGGGNTLRIGGGVVNVTNGGITDFFMGAIDDVAGWSTTLTAAQISTIYTSSNDGAGPNVQIPGDGTKYLAGSQPPAFQSVKDSDLSLTDITTNNVSTTKHGFAPKAPNDGTKYLDGTGAYSVPAGGAAGALTLLSTTTLSSNGTIDVSSINQTYNDLFMVLIVRGTRAATADFLQLQLNGDTAANYDGEDVESGGTAGSLGATSARIAQNMPAASATANDFGMYEISICGYTSTTWNKAILLQSSAPITSSATMSVGVGGGVWKSTAAVNRVTFFGGTTTNLLSGSTLRIYGRS